ncbi:MAG TPA: 6-hydroxymethylpterin diphosphokinase MptE-like protein [Kofleriaceae bacterium]|nr:6-hydroxymethylpterin diphosphokinase MptE-like protein [Kofleriaceae bacterium]
MRAERFESWRALVADTAALGAALGDAIERADTLAAVAAMVQLRRTRSALSRELAPSAADASAERVAELSALVIGTRSAEAVVHAWRNRPLPGDATLLRSPLGVVVLADAIIPEVWDFETDLVVLVGSGLEPVAEVLMDLGQRRIAIVGGDATVQPSAIVHAESTDELVAAVRTMVPGAPAQVVLRGALGIPADELKPISDALTSTLSDLRIHRNTVCAFSRTWIRQAMENLDALARWPSVATVGDRFAGVPMIIVAPGPSLAKNIDQLRSLRGRAMLACFSHSLKPVLAAGLVPDIVLTVDPQDVRYHFAGQDVSQSWLVNAATAHPSLFTMPSAGKLALSANSAIDDWIFAGLGEDAVVPGGGSVATTALSLALAWKCDPIIFVGLDLSFPGGQYYVATSSDGNARAEIDDKGVMRVGGWSAGFHEMKSRGGPGAPSERALELPAWDGEGTVMSSFMFSMFHRWFVERLAPGVDAAVLNCTEGGAFIPGMQHVPLANALAALTTTYDVRGTLAAIAAGCAPAARARALADHYTRYLASMRRCRRLAVRARTLIRNPGAARRPDQLARVEAALVSALRELDFLSLVAQREVEGATDVAIRAGTERTYLEASDRLLGALVDVIDEIGPQLRGAVGRLHSVHGGL